MLKKFLSNRKGKGHIEVFPMHVYVIAYKNCSEENYIFCNKVAFINSF